MIKPRWLSLTLYLPYILIYLPGGSVPFFINDLGMGGSVLVHLAANARLGDVMNTKKKKIFMCANNIIFS